jgi:hypothetical protein
VSRDPVSRDPVSRDPVSRDPVSCDPVSLGTRALARPARPAAGARIRHGSLAVLVLTVLEYGLGVYVNLYVSVPAADRGGDLGSAVANGPAVLSVHAVTGLLLGLAALGVLTQAVLARHPGAIAASALGLFALAFADVTGTSYTSSSSGAAADSMGIAVLTGAALLCYAANLYLLRRPPYEAGTTGAGKSRV